VSEFIDALKTELESTFKEEISVYFDINPHDELLETHDVDASLKEKLKCLIFIPVISRTYCDPNSFAWEHEFKAFAEQASNDQFGLKVKLPNGNVASRVLPVRGHLPDPGRLCAGCRDHKPGYYLKANITNISIRFALFAVGCNLLRTMHNKDMYHYKDMYHCL